MRKKYLNQAFVGNENMVISFSEKGELLRLFYPNRDCRQFVETLQAGVKVNDSALIYLHDDINNQYSQYYSENTNVLNTQIENTYFNLEILQTDFVTVDQNVYIRKYAMTNHNSIALDVDFLIYSQLLSSFNNMVGSKVEDNILMQYSHNYTFSIFSKLPIKGYRLNNSGEEIKNGVLCDKDYIGMARDSGVSFSVGKIEPGKTKEFEIFVYINNNREIYAFDQIKEKIETIRKMDTNKALEKAKKYWRKYVKQHDGLKILEEGKQEKWKEVLNSHKQGEFEKVKNIYTRTILLFPLLENHTTGGISAALEVDEEKDKSGRYSYCWPRDAVFTAKASDILKMYEDIEKFYTVFSKNTQSKNGMWEQRFFTDGRLAPCWGYQIDETASVVFGVYVHYYNTKNKAFLKETLDMCEKAINYLKKYIDYITGECVQERKNEMQQERFVKNESYDLWEMHEGIHLYSLAAIFGAFEAMEHIYENLREKKNTSPEKQKEEQEKIESVKQYGERVRKYCLTHLCDEETKVLRRNNKDQILDISILGAVTPFRMLDPNEKEVKNTIEKIDLTLRTYTGGYVRFENDSYIGGNNPWPIATLWMALYWLQVGEKEKAGKCIEFVTDTATKHGLLAEQIDNASLQSKWVIGLGWSHAMYITALYSIGLMNHLIDGPKSDKNFGVSHSKGQKE